MVQTNQGMVADRTTGVCWVNAESERVSIGSRVCAMMYDWLVKEWRAGRLRNGEAGSVTENVK